MKKILSIFSLFFFLEAGLFGWQVNPAETKPPPPLVLLNAAEHLLCGKSRDGKIEFEDGTKFKVLSAEALKVYEEWDYYDHLSVTPNVMPMGGSEYYITNHDKDDVFVHANFLDKPYGNSDYTQFINHIDKHEGRVSIFNENGNEFWWMIEPKDLSKAEKWHEKDRVIIGKNNVWIETFYTDCQYIMINLDRSHLPHIRMSPLYNND